MFDLMNKGSLPVSPFQGSRFTNLHNSKHSNCSLYLFILSTWQKKEVFWTNLFKSVSLYSCSLRLLSLTNVQKNLSSHLSCPYCSLLTSGKYYLLRGSRLESASTCCSPHTAISNCMRSESSWQGDPQVYQKHSFFSSLHQHKDDGLPVSSRDQFLVYPP